MSKIKNVKILRVKILPGCVSCGTCSAVCPEVFKVITISQVIEDADLQENKSLIEEAADMCPVSVIEIECSEGFDKS